MMDRGSWCPQCGPDVTVDEDGCCVTCGATATGDGADAVLAMRAEIVERLRPLAALGSGLEQDMAAERDGMLRLRAEYGARDDEGVHEWIARLYSATEAATVLHDYWSDDHCAYVSDIADDGNGWVADATLEIMPCECRAHRAHRALVLAGIVPGTHRSEPARLERLRTQIARLDDRMTAARKVLDAALVPHVVPYPLPVVGEEMSEYERSLRAGGRARDLAERIAELAASRDHLMALAVDRRTAVVCDACGIRAQAMGLLDGHEQAGDQCPCCYLDDVDCDGVLVPALPTYLHDALMAAMLGGDVATRADGRRRVLEIMRWAPAAPAVPLTEV